MTDPSSSLDLCVAIIVCDAQRTIEQTIRSVNGLARRVLVVDSGSTDGTQTICRELGAEVVHHDWEGYGRQKQFALELCDSEWVLCLDADESLDNELIDAVRRAVTADDQSIDAFAVNRRFRLGTVELRHTWQPEWKVRLARRDRARWVGQYHERLEVSGRVERLGGVLIHDAVADVKEFIHKQAMHGVQAAQVYYDQGTRGSVMQLLISPPATVFKQLVLRSAWRDGWLGWVAAFGSGIHTTAKHMRLLELTRGSNS